MAALLPLALLILAVSPLSAAGSRIELELWCDLDPIVQEGAGSTALPIEPEEAIRRMLEEARSILSGMIYGYTFSYTPSDEARAVAESFELDPRAEIPWGDPALRVAGTRLEEHRLRAIFRYELTPDQSDWRAAWQSGVISKAGGEGRGNVFLGYRERQTALADAVRESIRNHLRSRVLNKPREVHGELLLWEVPGTYASAGEYHTRVITRLRIVSITPYRVY